MPQRTQQPTRFGSGFGQFTLGMGIRHDAGASAEPYVAGTLLAARRVAGFTGLRRGLDHVLGA